MNRVRRRKRFTAVPSIAVLPAAWNCGCSKMPNLMLVPFGVPISKGPCVAGVGAATGSAGGVAAGGVAATGGAAGGSLAGNGAGGGGVATVASLAGGTGDGGGWAAGGRVSVGGGAAGSGGAAVCARTQVEVAVSPRTRN